ncbi:MAG: tetratricopeptide repeat protein [Verrucomicrobiae bacterium]|nr:tetratricopeptide repeat protein [Verrucomicrobiae bacterium]
MQRLPHTFLATTLMAGWLLSALPAATPEEKKLLENGRRASEDGLYDVAEVHLRRLLQAFPQSEYQDQVLLLLARALEKQGNTAELTALLTPVLVREPAPRNRDELVFLLAEGLYGEGRFPEALAHYRSLSEKNPEAPLARKARYGSAWCLFRQGDLLGAGSTFEALAKDFPGQEDGRRASLALAKIQIEQKNDEAAEKILAPLLTPRGNETVSQEALFWKGHLLARQKRSEEAQKIFQNLTGLKKAQPPSLVSDAWMALGDLLVAQKKFDEAARAFEQAAGLPNKTPRRLEALQKMVGAFSALNRKADGLSKIRSFIEKTGDSPLSLQARLVLARILLEQGDASAALAEAQKLTEGTDRKSVPAEAFILIAECFDRMQKSDEASAALLQAMQNSREDSQKATLLFKTADFQVQQKKFDRALDTFKKITTDFPRSAYAEAALFRLGQTHFLSGNPGAALTAFQSLLTQFPESTYGDAAQFETGQIYLLTGAYPKAREAFGVLMARHPKSRLLPKSSMGIAEAYFQEGKFAEAADQYNQFLKTVPLEELRAPAAFNRALAIARLGHDEKTLAEMRDFIETHPESPLAPSALFWTGNYHYSKQDYARAQAQFEALVKKFPRAPLADEAAYWAGKAAYSRQDYPAATALFQQVINGTDASLKFDARMRQGEVLRQTGQFESALLLYEAVLKESPNAPGIAEALLGKAVCLHTLKKYDEAISALNDVLKANPDSLPLQHEATYRLAKALEKKGRTKEALALYLDILYGNALPPRLQNPAPAKNTEFVWFGRAGFDAGKIKEEQEDWQGAIQIYKILESAGGPISQEARERKTRLQAQHMILDEVP